MNRQLAMLLTSVGLALGLATPARAEGFTFSLGDVSLLPGASRQLVDTFYPQATALGLGDQLAAQLQLQVAPRVDALAQEVRLQVDDLLTPLDFRNFLHNSANAGALAAKAMPVDYASAIRIFSLSVGGGAAVGGTQYLDELRHPQRTIDNVANSVPPNVGIAPDLAVSLGINLGAFRLPRFGAFDLRKVQLFVSAFKLGLHADDGQWTAKTATFGGYAKYQVMRERALVNRHVFLWHGLNVLTGLGYSGHHLRVKTSLPTSSTSETLTFEGQSLNINAGWSGDAKIGVDMHTYTIPIEVTSALQLVYALTLYGGAALDFNIGRSALSASAQAPVTVTASQGGKSVLLSRPEPSLTYDLQRKPTVVDVRGFVGLQVNAGVLALFAQISGDSSKTGGVHGGLRLFW